MATQNANTITVTGGTIDGTIIGGTTPAAVSSSSGALNGSIGATTPSTGAFTTVTATTPLGVASGGTGNATLTAHGVLLGEGTTAISQTAVGTTGQMLLGVTGADPAFGNNPIISGGTINGTPIGATTPSTASVTTLIASGAITPSTTAGIVGTTAANNANAGSVGEFPTPTNLTGVSLSSGVAATVASISLTAGDYDVSGTAVFIPAGTTLIASENVGISTTAGSLGALGAYTSFNFNHPVGSADTISTPVVRINVSVTTTVYCTVNSMFSTSTATASGFIRARRVR
jgi:hypothetical protein